MIRLEINILAAFALMILSLSCIKEEVVLPPLQESEELCFIADPMTRGAELTSANLTSFSVYASKADGTSSKSFFSDLKVSRDPSSGLCNSEKAYYWPGQMYTLEFLSIAPYAPEGLTVVMDNDGLLPEQLDYVVPEAATAQSDIMVASPGVFAGDYNSTVPLTFRHICAAVNVKVGDIPAGTIKSIIFRNICKSGTYDIAEGDWTPGGEVDDYSVVFTDGDDEYYVNGNEDGNPLINDDEAIFMMVPQTLPSDAELEVTFVHGNTGKEVTLAKSLAGGVWTKGKPQNYILSITPDCKLEFMSSVERQDAHYVICRTEISVDKLVSGKSWQLVASADDGADVSVQLEEDVNSFAKQGFWTDKVMLGDEVTSDSARGTSSISSSAEGIFSVYVFIPENVGSQDRVVTLTLKTNDGGSQVSQEIVQSCPAWTGTFGWENVDDNESGPYGFNWNRKVAYIFPYNLGGWPNKYTVNEARELVEGLISQYDASSYASFETFKFGIFNANTRSYVYLDYSKLNNLSVAESSTDGLSNTKALSALGGSATTSAFEEALKNTYKTEEGHEHENMFRLPGTDDSSAVPRPSGDNNVSSGILNYIMKKNRYYLRINTDTSIGSQTTAPYIKEQDILWYLPAYGQFSLNDGISSADYWSSTASSGGTDAYLGNGSTDNRANSHKVIAVRNR